MWARYKTTGDEPTSRSFHGAGIIGSTMVIFGGQSQTGVFLNDVCCLNIKTKDWTRPVVHGKPPCPRILFSFVPVFHPKIEIKGKPSNSP